jgi:hypothetical protein
MFFNLLIIKVKFKRQIETHFRIRFAFSLHKHTKTHILVN